MSSNWQRRFFLLRDGRLEYRNYTRGKGLTSTVVAVAVVLLSTRVSPNPERRWQFELILSSRSYIVHAESEADMRDWIASIELARVRSLDNHTDARGLSEDITRKIHSKLTRMPSTDYLTSMIKCAFLGVFVA